MCRVCTCDGREAGQRVRVCDLHTGHVQAAGVQRSEAVVAVGGGGQTQRTIGAQFRVVQAYNVTWVFRGGALVPGHQQHGRTAGLQPYRQTSGIT